MRTIQKCLALVEGYPTYREEIRFYVLKNGEVIFGPFKTETEAEEYKEAVLVRHAE